MSESKPSSLTRKWSLSESRNVVVKLKLTKTVQLNDDAKSNYLEDLRALNTNSKPLINMLSQVAAQYTNKPGAESIVKMIVERLQQVIKSESLSRINNLHFGHPHFHFKSF